MRIKKSIKENEVEKIKVANSTVRLITKDLMIDLDIALPLCERSIDILAKYFEEEEISLAQDQADNIPYNEQYMKDVCRAVDDFSPSADNTVIDINDLNDRIRKQNN